MAYTKQHNPWVDNVTVINAADMNGIETGIANAHTTADGAAQKSANLSDLANTTTARTNIGAAATSHTHASTDISDSSTVGRSVLTAADATAARTATGAAAASHTHAATDLASGTVATARLGSGTADGTTFLRGDQTWAVPAGGGGAVAPGPDLWVGRRSLVPVGFSGRTVFNSAVSQLAGMKVGLHKAVTADAAAINVATLEAGSTIRVGVYACGSNGFPAAKLWDSGQLSGAAAGVVSVTSAISLPAGDVWVLYTTSSVTTLRIKGWGYPADALGDPSSTFFSAAFGFRFGAGGDHPTGTTLPSSLAAAAVSTNDQVSSAGGPILQLNITAVA